MYLGLCIHSLVTDGNTVKPVLSGHSKRRQKISFQNQLSLNACQKDCRMLQESILQYFRPSLRYNSPLRPLFCLFLSGRLRQVLLYKVMLSWFCLGLFLSTTANKINSPLAGRANPLPHRDTPFCKQSRSRSGSFVRAI